MEKVETALEELEKINNSIENDENEKNTIEVSFPFGDKLKTKERINFIGNYITKGALKYIEPFYKPKKLEIKKQIVFFKKEENKEEESKSKPFLLSLALLSSVLLITVFNSPFLKMIKAFSDGKKNINEEVKNNEKTLNESLKDTLLKITKSDFNDFIIKFPYYFYYPFFVMEDVIFHVFNKKEEKIIGWGDLSFKFHIPLIVYEIFMKTLEIADKVLTAQEKSKVGGVAKMYEDYDYLFKHIKEEETVEIDEAEINGFASKMLNDYKEKAKENVIKATEPLKNQAEYAKIAYNLSKNISEGDAKIWTYFRYEDAKQKEKIFSWSFDGKKWTFNANATSNPLLNIFSIKRLQLESKNKEDDEIIKEIFGERLNIIKSIALSSEYAKELYSKGNVEDKMGNMKRSYDYYYEFLLTTAKAIKSGTITWKELYEQDEKFDEKLNFFIDSVTSGLEKDIKRYGKNSFTSAKAVLLQALDQIGKQLEDSGQLSSEFETNDEITTYKDPLMRDFLALHDMIENMEDNPKEGNKLLMIISNLNKIVTTKENKAWSLLQKLRPFSLKKEPEKKELPDSFTIYEKMVQIMNYSNYNFEIEVPEMGSINYDDFHIEKIVLTNKSSEVLIKFKKNFNENLSLKREAMKALNNRMKTYIKTLK